MPEAENLYVKSAQRRKERLAAEQGSSSPGTEAPATGGPSEVLGGTSIVSQATSLQPTAPPALRVVGATPGAEEEEQARHQGIYTRPIDEERIEVATTFMRRNRRLLKSRRQGLSTLCRAGLDLLVQTIESDPDVALQALARAIPRSRS